MGINHKLIHYQGKRTYVPQLVYKSLLKMVLTISPETELPNVRNAMDFLMGRKKIQMQTTCDLPSIFRASTIWKTDLLFVQA